MKISILMPTYNDSDTILQSIESVLNQDYDDFELIIVDDGSTDNTNQLIKNILDKRVKYFFQKNSDQLNALINAFNKSTGDIIYILHSDDLLYNNETLKNAVTIFENGDVDAVKGEIFTIDDNSNITGRLEQRNIVDPDVLLVRTMLLYGTNLLNDFSFVRRSSFEKFSYNNYLIWNTPFWINWDKNKPELINVKNYAFGMLKYRVYEGNYLNSDIGKLNVINGNIRNLTNLMMVYTIPLFSFQRLLFRFFKDKYKPLYIKKETKNKHKVLKRAIKFRTGNIYKKNIYLTSLLDFYKQSKKSTSKRSIHIENTITNQDVFYGKDMRKFNVALLNNNLPDIYYVLFREMKNGFNEISVNSEDRTKISYILKFLSISNMITISDDDQ
ncbi:MAG: glycosyltransferase [Acholeplasma sp.]|nr:glycosyltransferase [Acholeplasma sp.]